MSFKKLVIGAAAVLSLAACSKSNDSQHGAAAVSAPALDNNGQGTYSAGTPAMTFNVASEEIAEDGVAINDYNGFSDPNLGAQVDSLRAVDQVIETQQNTLELWSQGNLLLAFDMSSGTPTLLKGAAFNISSATFLASADSSDKQGQSLASADLTINMPDCAVEQPKQEQEQGKVEQPKQEQGQDQGKIDQGQDQGKIDQGQDQGKKSLVSEDVTNPATPDNSAPQALPQQPDMSQGQGKQDQGKQEQAKPEEKAPACRNVSIVYHLTGVEQPKQEQEQGKMDQGQDQGKVDQGQDQGKAAPIDQSKDQGKVDQGQDQGKAAPIDQGKQDQGKVDQGQDQGKAAPIDQSKDQGKVDQGQDQGKAAPIDQGKQDQGKVDQGQDQGKTAPIDQGQSKK